MQAYGSIFAARQTMASDMGAQSGQRARRRGREDDDDEEGGGGTGGGM